MTVLYHEYRFLMRESDEKQMSKAILRAARLQRGFHPSVSD